MQARPLTEDIATMCHIPSWYVRNQLMTSNLSLGVSRPALLQQICPDFSRCKAGQRACLLTACLTSSMASPQLRDHMVSAWEAASNTVPVRSARSSTCKHQAHSCISFAAESRPTHDATHCTDYCHLATAWHMDQLPFWEDAITVHAADSHAVQRGTINILRCDMQDCGSVGSRQMAVRQEFSRLEGQVLQQVPVECWNRAPVMHWLLWQQQHHD